MNVIARSFKFCGITSNNILDYGSQLRHFVQNNEFVDDIEETTDDLDLNDGDEWDQATQDIIESAEDVDEDANEL